LPLLKGLLELENLDVLLADDQVCVLKLVLEPLDLLREVLHRIAHQAILTGQARR